MTPVESLKVAMFWENAFTFRFSEQSQQCNMEMVVRQLYTAAAPPVSQFLEPHHEASMTSATQGHDSHCYWHCSYTTVIPTQSGPMKKGPMEQLGDNHHHQVPELHRYHICVSEAQNYESQNYVTTHCDVNATCTNIPELQEYHHDPCRVTLTAWPLSQNCEDTTKNNSAESHEH